MGGLDLDEFEDQFKRTFDKLRPTLGIDTFKKYDGDRDSFSGAFNVSAFELLTSGITKNIDIVENMGNEDLKERIKDIYSEYDISLKKLYQIN